MTNNTLVQKSVSIMLAAFMLIVSVSVVSATPGVHGAALSVVGAVEVNGQKATSGGTVFPDNQIVTREQSGATINLGVMGRVALFASSTLCLSFSDSGLKGRLDQGEARVSTPAGVSVTMATPGGIAQVDGGQPTSFTVTTQNGETKVAATVGTVELISDAGCTLISARDDTDAGGLPNQQGSGGSRKAVLMWVALGGAVAAAIWVVAHDTTPREEDLDFGGTVTIPSG
jgi:hypothetical protein